MCSQMQRWLFISYRHKKWAGQSLWPSCGGSTKGTKQEDKSFYEAIVLQTIQGQKRLSFIQGKGNSDKCDHGLALTKPPWLLLSLTTYLHQGYQTLMEVSREPVSILIRSLANGFLLLLFLLLCSGLLELKYVWSSCLAVVAHFIPICIFSIYCKLIFSKWNNNFVKCPFSYKQTGNVFHI